MTILEHFDLDVNFWEMHPQFRIMENFKDLYRNDKSRGKKDSSQLMWAIALLLDKSKNNAYRNLPDEEKREQLAKHFLKIEDFDWESSKMKNLIDTYKKFALSQAERTLIAWEEKMKERDIFIKNTPYNLDTAKTLDDIFKNTTNLMELYRKMVDIIEMDNEKEDKSNKKYTTEI